MGAVLLTPGEGVADNSPVKVMQSLIQSQVITLIGKEPPIEGCCLLILFVLDFA